jgi:heat shock protein HspQ
MKTEFPKFDQGEYALFGVGQLVYHKLFGYRGVVVDVDPIFSSSEEWYETMAAKTRPPRNNPWYHVLVHGGGYETYVAERNLEADDLPEPVEHSLVASYFQAFEEGRYIPRRPPN